ncbi:TPA: hypothetical protein ACH3X1_007045 [Trebouxia sp. C0004]
MLRCTAWSQIKQSVDSMMYMMTRSWHALCQRVEPHPFQGRLHSHALQSSAQSSGSHTSPDSNDHHLELVNHHQKQLECLARLLDSQNQLSPPQPVSDGHTSVPAVPVNYTYVSAPLIFPGTQSSTFAHFLPRPVEGPFCPVEGLPCPGEGPSCPVEGLSCSVEGPTCPVEGSSAPVRRSACPAERLAGLVDGYPVQGPFQGNTQLASRPAANCKAHLEEGFQLPLWTLPVPYGTAAQAASSSSIAATTPIVKGGLVEPDTAAVHRLAGRMEADAVAAAIGLTALKLALAECAGITSRQQQNAQLTAATFQRAQPQHQRQRNSNKNSSANSTNTSVTTYHQLRSADFSAKSRQLHQTDVAAAPLATSKNPHRRLSRFHQTLGALQRPQHHAADHAASCSLHEQQSAACDDSTRVLPVRHPHRAGKAPSGFTEQQQTAAPAGRGCKVELAGAQPASSAELSTTCGFHDDRSHSYLPNNHHRPPTQLSAFSNAGAFQTTARTADAGSRAVPDNPEDPQASMDDGSLRPAQDGFPAFQTMGAVGNASRAVCNSLGTSPGTMGPISGASTATCSSLKPHSKSMGRHNHDSVSSAQPAKQIHDSAMPDAIMAEADEEPVSYSRRRRRICLPARFQATPCLDSQEPKQALRRQKCKVGDEWA